MDRMQSFEMMGGPLSDAAIWRGALFWALALYIPLSAPLSRLEESLEDSPLTAGVRQTVLIGSSLLVALVSGLLAQLVFSWILGPEWGSSLALIGIGWSLLLVISDSGKSED